jgi:hypothetical protein
MDAPKIQFRDFTSLSAKAPSAKAVKKAAAVLKDADKAKVADISGKLKELIDQAVQIGTDNAAERKVSDAQMSKLQAQMAKIENKQNTAFEKADAKIAKLAPRIAKLQDQVLKAGGKNMIPPSLSEYFKAPVAQVDVPKKAKKGLKDLKKKGVKKAAK